jgi:hypothetical protein
VSKALITSRFGHLGLLHGERSGALEGALFIVAYASLVWLIGSAILYLLARR